MWIQLSDEQVEELKWLIDQAEHQVQGASDTAAMLRERIEHYSSPEANNQAYRDAVNTRDGELEVDDDAVISISEDGGAYVMAWVWVGNEEIE